MMRHGQIFFGALLVGVALTLGFSGLEAKAQNPAVLERMIHPVKDHGPDDKPPEIGFVVDTNRSVVCYFFMRRHWYEGHPTLSCVHVGPDMLLDDEPIGGHLGQ